MSEINGERTRPPRRRRGIGWWVDGRGELFPAPAPETRTSTILECVWAKTVLTFLIITLLVSHDFAAEQKFEHLFPPSGQQGTTVAVSATGKFSTWPPQVWVDASGITFKAGEKAPKFEVTIANDAPVGPHLVRFYNDHESTFPFFFLVSREQETLEVEPNDDFKSPQKIAALPALINGRLEKSGDVDSYAVTLKQGETLVAWVEAYVLAATFDPLLRVVDENGLQLAFNHDGRTLDPFLAWPAPHDGTFVVQLMGFTYPPNAEERLAGGEDCIYRLHLTNGPFVQSTRPLCVPRERKTAVRLAGWNLRDEYAEIDTTHLAPNARSVELNLPGILSDVPVMTSNTSEILEIEPNDTIALAQPIDLPAAITGLISPAGDEDHFAFFAEKQHAYELALSAAEYASPLDAWLEINAKDGKSLARNEDAAGGRIRRLNWTAPSDGFYFAGVGDITHHGGRNFIYHLTLQESKPEISATVADPSFVLKAGKTEEVKVTLKRSGGFKSKLHLSAENLPAGVTAEPMEIGEKGNDTTIKLTAAADVKAANQPIQFLLREADGNHEYPVRYVFTSGSESKDVLQGYSTLVIDSTDQLWLTVIAEPPKAPEPPETAPPK